MCISSIFATQRLHDHVSEAKNAYGTIEELSDASFYAVHIV
jgi:hypothetical protein